MKYILILICFLGSTSVYANAIDSLQTDDDVILFLKKIYPMFAEERHKRTLRVMPVDEIKKINSGIDMIQDWNIKSWQKLDLNNDGRTDLIANTWWYNMQISAVIDKGQNEYELIDLTSRSFYKKGAVMPVKIGNEQCLLVLGTKYVFRDTAKIYFMMKEVNSIDTLIYKFGGFVEKNDKPVQYDISKIQFQTSSGWNGVSPIYVLNFSDQMINWEGTSIAYKNDLLSPKKINKEKIVQILDLIQYMDISRSRPQYSVPWTDDTTMYLKIIFKNGSMLSITDYGMTGSYSLSLLYRTLLKLTK